MHILCNCIALKRARLLRSLPVNIISIFHCTSLPLWQSTVQGIRSRSPVRELWIRGRQNVNNETQMQYITTKFNNKIKWYKSHGTIITFDLMDFRRKFHQFLFFFPRCFFHSVFLTKKNRNFCLFPHFDFFIQCVFYVSVWILFFVCCV